MTTTDVKRARPSAAGAARVDGTATAPDAQPLTNAEDAKRSAEIAAVIDVLDAGAPAPKGGRLGTRGANAALLGLDVVGSAQQTQQSAQPTKPTTSKWRAAVVGALLGLSALVGGTQTAHAAALGRSAVPQMMLTRDNKPVTTLNALSVQLKRGSPSGDPPSPPTVLVANDEVRVSVERDAHAAPTSIVIAPVRGGLPDVLATTTSGMTVTHGSDPGDFYCEHAFFTSTSEGLRPDTSILRNGRGEVMTGFLHVPSDKWTYDATAPAPHQSERHRDRREIVGNAMRGYFDGARGMLGGDDAEFRMLITGYAQWGGVVNNPTGDFVMHRENVDAAMRHAFGEALIGDGHVVDSGTERARIRYAVRDPSALNGVRFVVVEAARLPVTDAAIDAGPDSLQSRIRAFAPHAVMSMGVTGSSTHLAEFHADNGGLRVFDDGTARHDDGASPTLSHPDNYALARAIHRGQELTRTTTPPPPTTTTPVVADGNATVTPGDVVAVTTPATVSTTSTTPTTTPPDD